MRIPIQALRNNVMARFDAIVSERIIDGDERRRLSGLMAILIAAGLAAALGMPMAALLSDHAGLVVLAAMTSGGCLALAALAASGAFDAVVGGAVAGGSLLIAVAATWSGGAASPLLWLLPIVPMEAVLSGRRNLFWACFGIASLALCLVLGAMTFSASFVAPSLVVTLAAAAVAVSCLATQIVRLARRRGRALPECREFSLDDAAGRIVVRFAPDGAMLDASDDARRVFGERLGSDRLPFALSLVHVADRVRYLSAFGEIRAGAAMAGCEVRLWDAGAHGFRQASVGLVAVRNAAVLIAIASVCELAPDEARPTEDLEAALTAARAASEAKSGFLAMVSHELRTPLNAIIGFSDVLDRELFGGFGDPRQKEYVGLIRQSGEHLLAVVNGLLDISKIEAGRYELVTESFDIADVLDGAVATLRGEAERKGLALSVRNECGSGRLVADRRAVHQIIVNLVANAVKFTEEGQVDVAVRENVDVMRITVADSGIGIAAAELPRLGQPFTQGSAGLTRRYPGTGLGLSLVKGFAELHRGSMRISSELGRGTVVDVTLSLDCEASVEHNEPTKRVVALKHARHQEAQSPIPETRRSA